MEWTKKAGVWSIGTKEQIKEFIEGIERIKDNYYNIVGSDEVFNGLDTAIHAAEKLLDLEQEKI